MVHEALHKEKSRRIQVVIRRVLMSEWDPIGVAEEPMAANEYDAYLGGLLELLQQYASGERLEEHLRLIETTAMGLTDLSGAPLLPDQRRFQAVDALQQAFDEEMLGD